MLDRIQAATGGAAKLVWIDEQRLAEAGIEAWDELPLWLDLTRHPDFNGFLALDIGRALAAGLTFRPLEQTAADTLAWVHQRTAVAEKSFGTSGPPARLSHEREAELLAQAPQAR